MTAECGVARGHVSATGPPLEEGVWPQIDAVAVRRHLGAIRVLCDELGRPPDEVLSAYQCELRRLLAHAAVLDYLPVLVSKRVRELYRRRSQAREEGDPCAELLTLS